MKLKVLIISYHFSFSDSTGSLRPRAMMKYLPEYGIETAVLTYGSASKSLVFDDDCVYVRDLSKDNTSLFRYYLWRIWQKTCRFLGIYRSSQAYWRDIALNHAEEIISRMKPDVILASYPSIEALEVGLALSKKFSLPLVSDFRDGLLFEPVEAQALQSECVRSYYAQIEKKVISASNLILTVSEPISQYFRDRYSHHYVETLHNGFDLSDIKVKEKVMLDSDMINIVHTGRLAGSEKGRSVSSLCEALSMLKHSSPQLFEKIKIYFIGQLTKAEEDFLKPFVSFGAVVVCGHQSRERALGFQSQADVLLLIVTPGKKSIVTGKLFEYLAMRKPILALAEGSEAARIVRETSSGLVVPANDAKEIALALEYVVKDKLNQIFKCDEVLIEAFSREVQMKCLAKMLLKLREDENE